MFSEARPWLDQSVLIPKSSINAPYTVSNSVLFRSEPHSTHHVAEISECDMNCGETYIVCIIGSCKRRQEAVRRSAKEPKGHVLLVLQQLCAITSSLNIISILVHNELFVFYFQPSITMAYFRIILRGICIFMEEWGFSFTSVHQLQVNLTTCH